MGKSRSNRSNKETSERLRMALLYVFCCGRRGNIEDVEADKMTIGEEMRKAQNIIYGPSKSVKGVKLGKTAQNSEDDVTSQKEPKRLAPKRPAPKRPSVPPGPPALTKGPTKQQGSDCKGETDEALQHGDTWDNVEQEQKLSSSNIKLEISMSANETKPLEDYPECLNPFADDDDDGHNAAGNDGNNVDDADDGNNADGDNDENNMEGADNGNRADCDDAVKDDKDGLKEGIVCQLTPCPVPTCPIPGEATSRSIEDYPEELNPFADDEDVQQDEAVDADVGK